MEVISTNFPTKGTSLFLVVKEPVLDLARFFRGGCTAKFALPFKTPPASATGENHIG